MQNTQPFARELGGRLQIIRDYASELKDRGIFNFFYCDGEYLFVHSHKRTQTDGEVKPPGLNLICRGKGGFGRISVSAGSAVPR